MRVYPEFRLQLMYNNKWLVITHAWDVRSIAFQVEVYRKNNQIFRVQRLVNGQYK
jgi:hypothetical protein